MTDVNPQSPYRRATNLDAPVFDGEAVSLVDLFRHELAKGQSVIRERTFRNCGIEGPGIALILGNVKFDRTDFGYTGGDIRNLAVRPVGEKVFGAIPIGACRFENCKFFAVGFTGTEEFLSQLLAVETR
ncbi:MAG: hypothetical protein KA105_07935 [Caulobacter sp.]|jgi:hypothetical protein|nr:hypothetical protein [Caulobacter sp.]